MAEPNAPSRNRTRGTFPPVEPVTVTIAGRPACDGACLASSVENPCEVANYPNVKNAHIVPRTYLTNWAVNGKIAVRQVKKALAFCCRSRTSGREGASIAA